MPKSPSPQQSARQAAGERKAAQRDRARQWLWDNNFDVTTAEALLTAIMAGDSDTYTALMHWYRKNGTK